MPLLTNAPRATKRQRKKPLPSARPCKAKSGPARPPQQGRPPFWNWGCPAPSCRSRGATRGSAAQRRAAPSTTRRLGHAGWGWGWGRAQRGAAPKAPRCPPRTPGNSPHAPTAAALLLPCPPQEHQPAAAAAWFLALPSYHATHACRAHSPQISHLNSRLRPCSLKSQ